MASQVVSSTSQLEVFEMSIIYVRGYHGYMDIWTTVIGEVLLVKRETNNFHDVNTVHRCRNEILILGGKGMAKCVCWRKF